MLTLDPLSKDNSIKLVKLKNPFFIKNHESEYLNMSEPFFEDKKNILYKDKSSKDSWLLNKNFNHHIGNKFYTESNKLNDSLPTQIPIEKIKMLRNSNLNKKYKLFRK